MNKNTVSKQAKHISKITTKAFTEVVDAARRRSENLNKREKIAYHNAKKMNASIGQKIEKLIPPTNYNKTEDKIETIKKIIKQTPELVAREILSVLKTAEQIETEYNLIEVLNSEKPLLDQDLTSTKVHTLLVQSFYLYEEEFRKNKIHVNIANTDLTIKVDYGVVKSAFGQIFINAVKYCKSDSKIHVETKVINDYVEIIFNMTSLYFDEEEAIKLTEYGARGKQTEGIEGEGIGLYAVSKFMRMHRGYLKMSSNQATCLKSGNKTYSENIFILGFYKNH